MSAYFYYLFLSISRIFLILLLNQNNYCTIGAFLHICALTPTKARTKNRKDGRRSKDGKYGKKERKKKITIFLFCVEY